MTQSKCAICGNTSCVGNVIIYLSEPTYTGTGQHEIQILYTTNDTELKGVSSSVGMHMGCEHIAAVIHIPMFIFGLMNDCEIELLDVLNP